MIQAGFKKYQLVFKSPVLTSRGQMRVKNGYYLFITDGTNTGVGECSYIEGLSIDDLENYENALKLLCRYIETEQPEFMPDLNRFPSINFGWETATYDLENGGEKLLFESDFTDGITGIPINGLVWMGEKDFMLHQIASKLESGFNCIKIKVGAIAFEDELMLLHFIRQKFPKDVIEIRLDANGAFNRDNVFEKLDRLSKFDIHSIEQPVKPGQFELMAEVCKQSPIAVALDEELIGVSSEAKAKVLTSIKPQYLILKPSLLGGLNSCREWIELAEHKKIKWWSTSALESNIGLNAIAQWVYIEHPEMVQGLGTGGLYTNNISSPLTVSDGQLFYNPKIAWGDI